MLSLEDCYSLGLLVAAVLAAAAWNGVGSPDGYDKQAF